MNNNSLLELINMNPDNFIGANEQENIIQEALGELMKEGKVESFICPKTKTVKYRTKNN